MDLMGLGAVIGALLNGGWGLRFESEHAKTGGRIDTLQTQVDGDRRQGDERHRENQDRLVRIETKVDALLQRRGL